MTKNELALSNLINNINKHFQIMIQYFIEVPNTNIKEPVLKHEWASELCYQIAQDFGHAQIVWYALNGKRVVEGEYTDKD